MSTVTRRGAVVLLALALAAPAPALAQTAPSPAPAAPAPAAGRTAGTFAEFGYGETALRGTYGSAELFFSLPAGTRAQGDTVVELDLEHSPLLTPRSTLTVAAGGVPVASTRLVPAAAGGTRLQARVPQALVGTEGLALSLRGFLRLTDDECEETTNPALWVTVRGTSTVRLGTTAVPYDLEDAPELLVGRNGRQPVGVVVDAAEGDLLQAAGYAAAQVGRWQGERGGDAAVRRVEGDVARPHVVVAAGAATPEGLPVTWAGSGFTAAGAQVTGDQGLLAVAPAAPARLLVGGTDGQAAVRAARALTRPATVEVLGGPVAALTGREPADLPRASLPWQEGAASFAQLGIARQEVTGVGAREVRLTFDRPAGWNVREGASLDLVVDAGAALSGTSSVQVTLSGTELGSRRLEPARGPRTYRFDIPPGLADRRLDGRPVRSLELVLRFVLDVEDEACETVDPAAVRAAVLPTSAVRLPHAEFGGRDLGRFPHPLREQDGGRIAVVLPDDPDPVTLSAGLQAAAAVGRWSAAQAEPPVLVTASALPDDLRSAGLVLLGEAAAQLGSEVELGRPAVEPAAGEASVVLGLVDSPVGDDGTALLLQGEPEGLLLGATVLGSREGLGLLRGSRVALNGLRPPASLEAPGAAPPPELTPVAGGRFYEDLRPWTIPAVLIGVGLLVALGLVVRYRWRPAARQAP